MAKTEKESRKIQGMVITFLVLFEWDAGEEFEKGRKIIQKESKSAPFGNQTPKEYRTLDGLTSSPRTDAYLLTLLSPIFNSETSS